MLRRSLLLALLLPALVAADAPDADVADLPAQDLRAGGDANKRFFLIGPRPGDAAPAAGFGLVLVLPGGDGSADFHTFVKRIAKNGLPAGYVTAQLVAPKWADDQQIVWPTAKDDVAGAKFTTQEFIADVVEAVAGQRKLDRKRVFTLSWSSGGPAAYAAALQEKTPVTGSFIGMSVFKPDRLPPLTNAKGRAFYLYHSPDDRVCPYAMARHARKQLRQHGGIVDLDAYAGGHGWRAGLYDHIREGIEWLEGQTKEQARR